MAAIVWKGSISFVLVTFPVRLFSAARAESVHFHMLHKKDLSRVKEAWFCAKEEKQIDRDEIVKGYETDKGKYVVVESDELKQIAPATASAMEILQFVRKGEVDAIHYESSYYVGAGDDGAKPYSLFVAALEASKYEAIAKIAMHMREHIVLIRPFEGTLVLHTLYYADELHEEQERGSQGEIFTEGTATCQEPGGAFEGSLQACGIPRHVSRKCGTVDSREVQRQRDHRHACTAQSSGDRPDGGAEEEP
jgi:DNA end-binding protein Ku